MEPVASRDARLATCRIDTNLDTGLAKAAHKEKDMFDMDDKNRRLLLRTVAAIVVVVLAGLVLDLGDGGALPLGIVEIGEMTPITT